MSDTPQPAITQIVVKKDSITIDADLEDGWFSIVDRESDWYDDIGVVILDLGDLKELIDGLIFLYKDRVERNSG